MSVIVGWNEVAEVERKTMNDYVEHSPGTIVEGGCEERVMMGIEPELKNGENYETGINGLG